MNKIFCIISFAYILSFSCHSKRKVVIPQPIQKYCFERMDSSYFLKCYGPNRVFNCGEYYDEYCGGICRQDSIILCHSKNNIWLCDTVPRPWYKK